MLIFRFYLQLEIWSVSVLVGEKLCDIGVEAA
jgi:hypothetical protein